MPSDLATSGRETSKVDGPAPLVNVDASQALSKIPISKTGGGLDWLRDRRRSTRSRVGGRTTRRVLLRSLRGRAHDGRRSLAANSVVSNLSCRSVLNPERCQSRRGIHVLRVAGKLLSVADL